MTVLPVAAMSDLVAQEDHLDFLELPTHASLLVWMNNGKAPFTDLAFGQAIRMATNKLCVVIEAYQGFGMPASTGLVPNQLVLWHNADLEQVTFDIEGARRILEEAGYGWVTQSRLHCPPNRQVAPATARLLPGDGQSRRPRPHSACFA